MGADRAILLSDRKFGGADTWATSYTLAAALRNIPFDVIFSGRQAIDGDTAQVGPQIAEHLGLPQVTYVEHVEYDGTETFTVTKSTEEGYEILEVGQPCLFTVISAAEPPRYMNVRLIMTAYEREIEVWGFDHIRVDAEQIGLKGSPTRVAKSFTKGAKAMGALHEVSPEEGAQIIFEKLQEKFII